jgi:hypothetical protein
VTRREPEWDDAQEAWFLALAEYRASRCPCGCGQPVAESTAIENDGRYKATANRCHARAALAIEAGRYAKDPHPETLLYSVELRR